VLLAHHFKESLRLKLIFLPQSLPRSAFLKFSTSRQDIAQVRPGFSVRMGAAVLITYLCYVKKLVWREKSGKNQTLSGIVIKLFS